MTYKTILIIIFSNVLLANNWAEEQLEQMTPREMVAQLFMVTAVTNNFEKGYFKSPWKGDPEYVADLIINHKVGGIVVLGSWGLLKEHRKMINYYQELSDIPLLVAIDGEWLNCRIKDMPKMPTAMTMGAMPNEELIYKMGKERAAYCKALGAHIDFGPVFDVNTNSKNPIIGMRSFGDEPEAVARKAILFMNGLQESGIIACAKHFPGHGDTDFDSHIQLPVINHSKERLEQIELSPFKAAIEQGVMAIMPGHLAVPALEEEAGLPATFSKSIITDLLRNQLGFKGLVITDALAMGALDSFLPGEIELKSLLAGNDILLCSSDAVAAIDYIMQALEENKISLEVIKEKALRVLKAKEWAFEKRNLFVKEQELLPIYAAEPQELKKQVFDNAITVIGNLDILNGSVELLQIGLPYEKDFKHALEQYVKVNAHYSSWWVTENSLEKVRSKFKDNDKIVIALYNPFPKMPKSPNQNIQKSAWHKKLLQKIATIICLSKKNESKISHVEKVEITTLLEKLVADGKQLTLVVFGSPYNIPRLESYGQIIMAYEDDVAAQIAAAEILCGKLEAMGKLPVVIN